MTDRPRCRKCGKPHWGFQDCANVRTLEVVRNPPVGFRMFGNRMHTYQAETDNIFVLPRSKYKPTGTVTQPPDKAA
jgi:hypothetical protein